MLLGEWCSTSQTDQNVLGVSHLYANYRQSRRNTLITSTGVESFTAALTTLDLPTETDFFAAKDSVQRDGGLANFITRRAEQIFYRRPPNSATGPNSDFRIDGREIDNAHDGVFINLYRKEMPTKLRATGSSPKGTISPPPSATRVVWLTRPATVLAKMSATLARRKQPYDPMQFFSEITALLGLKRGVGPQTLYRLDLYRIAKGQKLYRPHGLSLGYPDRFCGRSSYRYYGTTADNRSGRAALPEAIVLARGAEAIGTGDPIYTNVKKKLRRIAPWIDAQSVKPIEAVLDTDQVHHWDLPYNRMQAVILARLRERPLNCNSHSSPACVCRSAPTTRGPRK